MPRANRSELPDSTGHAPPERLLVLTACGCLLLATLGACSRGDVHDLGAYCAQLAEQQDLVSGSIGSREDIATVTSVYESLQAAAPIDVEQDWQRLLDLIQTAATVDLADQSAQADLDAQAYGAAAAAEHIADHAQTLCGLQLARPGGLPAGGHDLGTTHHRPAARVELTPRPPRRERDPVRWGTGSRVARSVSGAGGPAIHPRLAAASGTVRRVLRRSRRGAGSPSRPGRTPWPARR
ncbi:MAG: hypothetical protein R2715_17110 [Ilumatobacteraceae bacterium]